MSTPRIYAGMTAQERDAQRRERLIDAAVELMGTRGAAETTVTAVCRDSGVTSRYFYQHFSDRDALLQAVAERVGALLAEAIVTAIPPTATDPETLTREPIRTLVEMIQRDPRLARILFIESSTEPILRRLRGDVMGGIAELMLRQAQVRLNISEAAAGVTHLAATVGVGGLFEVFRRWLDGELVYTTDELIEHCTGLLGSLTDYALRQDVVA